MDVRKIMRRGWLLLLPLLLVGCVANLGTAWPGVSLIDETHVMYAYEDVLVVVDVVTGDETLLLNSEGDPIIQDGEPVSWRISGGDYQNARFFAPALPLDEEIVLVPTEDRRLLRVNYDSAEVLNPSIQPLDARGSLTTSPTLIDDTIYLGLQGQLLALDENLSQRWAVETEHAVWSEPLVHDGIAYFTSLDHFMYAADIETGDLLWTTDLGGASAATPVLDEESGRMFVGTFSQEILALTLDGEIVDRYETSNWVWGTIALVNGRLYVGDLGGTIYNLDPTTLTEDGGWVSDISDEAVRATPLVLENYIVVGSRDQNVYWLNPESGSVIFDRPLDGEVLSDMLYLPANEEAGLDQALIVVATLSNREALVAFQATTGDRIWTFRR